MIGGKRRQLTQLYLEALMCDEANVMTHFTKVEQVCSQIGSQTTIRRALNKAMKQAAKLEKEKSCECCN